MRKQSEDNAFLLAEEKATIQHLGRSQTYTCKVFFDLGRNNSLLIEPFESLDEVCGDITTNDPFFVKFSGMGEAAECYQVSSHFSIGGDNPGNFVKLSPRYSRILIDHEKPLREVTAGVVNLGHYIFPTSTASFFSLSYEDWILDFTPVCEDIFLFPKRIQNDDYLFTYHLRIRRRHEELFTTALVAEQLHLLATFLSFCHGHWVSTSLTCGISADGTVSMEEWGNRKMSLWRSTTNWLDKHYGQGMLELFPKFLSRIADSAWKDAFDRAIYWYVRADTNLVGPDGACILLQAALERLAWHVLVRDRRSLSEEGFKKLSAADQLRLLLTVLRIPLTIPDESLEIRRAASEFNWIDGPQAFTEIRNRLVHPTKIGQKVKKLPYYEAYLLAKWYVELVILSACDYRGSYSNRTRQNRWVGQVEAVPWACN